MKKHRRTRAQGAFFAAIAKGKAEKNDLIQAGRRTGKTMNTTIAMTYKLADDLALTGDERIAFLQSALVPFDVLYEENDEGEQHEKKE